MIERPKPTAKALAIRWLARRELSRAELMQRLRRRGVEEADAGRALDELTSLGYLSDARCANAVVSQRKGRYGKRAIAHALTERGISKDDAAKALTQLTGSDEAADALALWQHRFGQVPQNEREKARQVRYLQARGYPLAIALRVLRAAGASVEEDAV